MIVFSLGLLLASYSFRINSPPKIFKRSAILAKQPSGSGIYEYVGPATGSPPPEIAAILSSGQKVRKVSRNKQGKSHGSNSKQPGSKVSISSGVNMKSSGSGRNRDNTAEPPKYDSANDDFESLERSLMSKYGSKDVKEKALDKLEKAADDRTPHSRRNDKFQWFRAESPGPASTRNARVSKSPPHSAETGESGSSLDTSQGRHWTFETLNTDDDCKPAPSPAGHVRSLTTSATFKTYPTTNSRYERTQTSSAKSSRSTEALEGELRSLTRTLASARSGRSSADSQSSRQGKTKLGSSNSQPFFKDEDEVEIEDNLTENFDWDDNEYSSAGYEDPDDFDNEDYMNEDDSAMTYLLDDARTFVTPKKTVAITPPTAPTGSKKYTVAAQPDLEPARVAQPVFRLRNPAPVTAQQRQAEQLREKQAAEKEVAKNMSLELKRAAAKNEFFSFQFEGGLASTVSPSGSKLFSDLSFEEIGVQNKVVISNLEKMGILQPTIVQARSVPLLSLGTDAVLQAHTGSGKTLAFLLPLLQAIDTSRGKVQAVVLATSRELVTQTGHVADSLFEGTGVRALTLIGGANVQNQLRRLREERPQVLIATPGRLAELVFSLQKIKLGNVRAVVIDEVDQLLGTGGEQEQELCTLLDAIPMLRRGTASTISTTRRSTQVVESPTSPFKTQSGSTSAEILYVDEISGGYDLEDIESTSSNEELIEDDAEAARSGKTFVSFVCLASATSSGNVAVQRFAGRYLRSGWQPVAADSALLLPEGITHGLISVPRIRALEMLRKFLNAKPQVTSAIVFVNDPHRVEVVCSQLLEMNVLVAPLHGDSSKEDRKEVLTRLRDGRIRVVVSTELAARGLDIPELSHVVNLELPTDAQHYVHRAGRCGRAGRQGLVMNFATTDTKFVVRRFGKQLRVKVMDCEIRDGQVFLKRR